MPTDVELQQRVQTLNELEHRHNLFAYKVDGWSAWRILRNAVHRFVVRLPMSGIPRSDAMRVVQALAATPKLLWLMTFGRQRELVVRTCRSALRMQQGESYRDVYFDGLLQRGHACLKLEEINSREFGPQAAAAFRPADLDTVVFTFWGRVLGTIAPVGDGALEYCESIAAMLAREFGISVDPAWLHMRLSTVYWQAKLFGRLLTRLKPKVVLVADTGEYALCLACHRHGVKFIELQHGVFDTAHPDAVPDWVDGTAEALVLPDVLACRGDFWIDQLRGTRQGQIAVAAGNELIDLARARASGRETRTAKHLVLTSQGLDPATLADWLQRMIQSAPQKLEWRLSIKLHPLYDADTRAYGVLKQDPRVDVIGGAVLPNVFDLLATADLHLSISSACHFDAAALGVPSVVIPMPSHEYVLDVVDDAQFSIARSPADVWKILARPRPAVDRSSRFAQPGFLDNLERLIA